MLIFIYGDDAFRVQEKVHTMKKAFAEKFDPTGLNTAVFPAEHSSTFDPGEILQSVCSAPFLGEKRMVIIRGLIDATKKGDQDVWVDGFSRAPDSTIVIFWEAASPKSLERKALFASLKKQADTHLYPLPMLEGAAVRTWATSRIKAMGATIESQALSELVNRVGADLWQLNSEIGKLVARAGAGVVTFDMVDELVRASFEGQVFALVDAVSRKEGAEALRLLQEERWSGASDHSLFGMLARQVRILLGARALLDEDSSAAKEQLAEQMGLHPFVAQKALQQARGFSFDDLKKVHDLLFEFDTGMKSGKIDAELAVDLVTSRLLL